MRHTITHAAVLRALRQAGIEHQDHGGICSAHGNGNVMEWVHEHDAANGLHVQGERQEADPRSDYFPGWFPRSIRAAVLTLTGVTPPERGRAPLPVPRQPLTPKELGDLMRSIARTRIPTEAPKATIDDFARRVEAAHLAHLERTCPGYIAIPGSRDKERARIVPGRRYTKVDVGDSGRFMVTDDGRIFGIKGYGVIHWGHPYGTLANPSPAAFER